MQVLEMEPGLKVCRCPHCRGEWLPFADYLGWVESGARVGTEAPVRDEPEGNALFGDVASEATGKQANGAAVATAPAKVKLCPECGRFLRRYFLGMGIEFEVERCGGCAGVWCDRGKWPRLKEAGAHARLHLLFSDSWQAKLKEEQIRKRQEDRVRSILGDADFEKARVWKEWVDGHPQRATLRAFFAEDFGERPPPSTR